MNTSHRPTFAELDRDGALEEAASRVPAPTRRAFFARTAAFVGGGLALGSIPVALSHAQDVPASDIAILNYALTLEYLEAAFYKEAIDKGALRGQDARLAEIIAEHELAHVDALKQTLGSKAVKSPRFDFKGTTDSTAAFRSTAMTLEDTGVAAYQGQATRIKTPAILKAAASILPVEARHAAWIRSVIGASGEPSPAPDAFQPSQSMDQVLTAVRGTGFITSMESAAPANPVSGSPNVAG